MSWLLGSLVLLVASPAMAGEVVWGNPVKGVQLGLALVPSSGPLPTELEFEAVARNATAQPQQLPAQACSTVRWTSFTLLHVRTASGRVFSYPIGDQPVNLGQRHRRTARHGAQEFQRVSHARPVALPGLTGAP
ncbi:hypothetical protein POL68_39165 [Stigmatella sp. ncwal1]|uniref:Uncharacterized protein n=1 Tax=Stigmatella ashevillensis TaxID=2995309 RepID=A0ABT5DNB3_9BACT|nr:hypothetical protein [Stigmatella ashevillena]MDC0714534.1 hypothetical protein [Stigmatella ashevillena]